MVEITPDGRNYPVVRYPLRFLTYPIHSTLFFGTISSITAILNKIIIIVQLLTNSTNQK